MPGSSHMRSAPWSYSRRTRDCCTTWPVAKRCKATLKMPCGYWINFWPGASTWASPFATDDGRVYFASAGKSYVLKVAEKFEILATNEIGEESRASAAVSDGRIYLRGGRNLYCIAKR